jgi:subtilisin family serine protease
MTIPRFNNMLMKLALLGLFFTSCKNQFPVKDYDFLYQDTFFDKNWFTKNNSDTLSSINLHKKNQRQEYNSKFKTQIVAVIDNETDIYHEALKESIWTNLKEIPNNNLDDDNNGYIDDINGWNFLGNAAGENNKYVNFESTRIIRKLVPYFQTKDTLLLDENDANLFMYLKKVQDRQKQRTIYFLDNQDNYDRLFTYYHDAIRAFKPYFTRETATLTKLDSLQQAGNTGISDFNFLVIKDCLESNINSTYVHREKQHARNKVKILLGLNYHDRAVQGDNADDFSNTNYGNNMMSNNVNFLDHGTKMSGIIAGIAQRNEVKIMPLAISAYGDEHDKDISLAIRYAVDNGAKVINMSFWKEFSLYEEWVHDAIKYAASKDVLIISIAGNDGLDLNINKKYPNDRLSDGSEVADNFILVGASNKIINEELMLPYSNYGNRDVDLFAPGTDIYTTAPNNSYINDANGTSSAAAVTSGVAALIRAYYPKLTASQVKHILMDSGVEYTIEVATPTTAQPDKTTPFNQLSKSGKILNAYNAMLLAAQASRGR